MKIDFVIIGGGTVGCFAKRMIPEAVCFDRGGPGDAPLSSLLGANMSRVRVPELKCEPGLLRSTINGEVAKPETIKRFKATKGSGPGLTYGDFKQFLPVQPVFFIGQISEPVQHHSIVKRIDVVDKKITIESEGADTCYEFGCIISTIPLVTLLGMIDLFRGQAIDFSLVLPCIPIYYKEELLPESKTPDNEVLVDYLVGDESPIYRRQYSGKRMSAESFFKFDGAKKIFPGKLVATPQAEEIAKDLQIYNIFCYGRYSRWRPTEHLHETFKNLRRFKERKGQIGYC